MKKNLPVLIGIYGTIILIGIIIAVFFFRQSQEVPSKATAPSCPAQGATCSFKSDEIGVSFKVEITDETTGQKVVTVTTTDKSVSYTPIPDHTYRCVVTPINNCGEGIAASVTNTCRVTITNTPTPTATPTEIPTPTPPSCSLPNTCIPTAQCTTEEGTETVGTCAEPGTVCCIPKGITPTVTPTPTETPTPTATATPTPSETPTPIPTNTPYPTATPYPSATVTPTPLLTSTPNPTYTPYPTYTNGPTPTPTEIIIVVNNTNTPTPIREGTVVPTIPSAGTPVAWFIILIPLAMLALGLVL